MEVLPRPLRRRKRCPCNRSGTLRRRWMHRGARASSTSQMPAASILFSVLMTRHHGGGCNSVALPSTASNICYGLTATLTTQRNHARNAGSSPIERRRVSKTSLRVGARRGVARPARRGRRARKTHCRKRARLGCLTLLRANPEPGGCWEASRSGTGRVPPQRTGELRGTRRLSVRDACYFPVLYRSGADSTMDG